MNSKKYTDSELKGILGIDDVILARFKEIREAAIREAEVLALKTGPFRAIGVSGSARSEFDMAAENSHSEFLLTAALDELTARGVITELVPLRDYRIEPCKCCYSTTNAHCHFYCSCYPKGSPTGDDMSNILYDKVLDADIIVFATPVNNFKISSRMALFIDRCISLDGSLAPADPAAAKDRELNIKHSKFIQMMADDDLPGSGYLRRFFGKTAGIIVTGHEEGAALAISQLFMALNHFGMAFPPFNNMYAMSSVLRGTFEDTPIVENETYIKEAKILAQNVLTMAEMSRKNRPLWRYDHSSN